MLFSKKEALFGACRLLVEGIEKERINQNGRIKGRAEFALFKGF